MARATLTLLLGLLAGAPAAAQYRAEADSASQDFRQRLLRAIALSPAQGDSLRQLRTELQIDIDFLQRQVRDGHLIPYEGRLRYREALDAYREARDAMLTEEQRALLARAQRYQREQQLNDGARDEDQEESLIEALEMSGEQRRRWLSLLARLRDEVRVQREDGQTPTPADLRRLREQHRLAFEAILTVEQLLELDRIRAMREQRRLEQERRDDLDLFEGFIDDEPDTTASDVAEP